MTTRRKLLLMTIGIPASEGERIPVDPSKLNAFAEQFNSYIRLLTRGEISILQWRQVRRLFHKLEE